MAMLRDESLALRLDKLEDRLSEVSIVLAVSIEELLLLLLNKKGIVVLDMVARGSDLLDTVACEV